MIYYYYLFYIYFPIKRIDYKLFIKSFTKLEMDETTEISLTASKPKRQRRVLRSQ